MIGLVMTFFAGLCFSLFSPAFNLATNDQWHTLKDDVPHLTVYAAFFYFSIACLVLAVILNVIFLYHLILNLPKSLIRACLLDRNGRGWAFLAGLFCGLGNGLQFMGGQAAGYAAADAVQALPLVSTFWGILLFGEYRRSSRRTCILLVSHALHVYCGCWSPDCIRGAAEMNEQFPYSALRAGYKCTASEKFLISSRSYSCDVACYEWP